MSPTSRVQETGRHFDGVFAGTATHLELADGRWLPLPAHRWYEQACQPDDWLLGRCHGPTLDLGCGPGRLVEALVARGLPVLGVDSSDLAIRHCQNRGAPVLRADVFGPLPGEGEWQHALLADGNIGIGGDPVRLLRRAAALVHHRGTVLVEISSGKRGMWRGKARATAAEGTPGPWFPWAMLGPDVLPRLARRASLRVVDCECRQDREFAVLERARP